MKQIIPFVKDVSLNTKISEVTSIALEHNLQMENSDSIVGSFIISGKYKINEISINEEVFEKEIPFDITLDDKYDATKVQIDIDDFYYEIINEEILRVHIDVLANNLVYCKEERKEPEEKQEILEEIKVVSKEEKENEVIEMEEKTPFDKGEITDEKIINDEIKEPDKVIEEVTLSSKEDNGKRGEDIVVLEEKKEEETLTMKEDSESEREDVAKELSASLINEKEQYVTYKVHIIRDDETIDLIAEKYSVTKEELEKYNTLDNVVIGSKIIIPMKNE